MYRLRRGVPDERGNRLGGPGGEPGHVDDRPFDSAAWLGAPKLRLSFLLYIPLYTATVFCACCPGPLRRPRFLAQVQGRVGFSDFGDMLFSWDKVALGGNISKDFMLLRRGVLIRANGRLAGPENGCVVVRARAAIDRRSAASRVILVFAI